MIDARRSPEITAVILSLRQMQKQLRRDIFKSTRTQIVPEWRQVLAAEATTSLEERVLLGGARADVTDSTVRLKAAQSTKKMSGGASPRDIGHAVEFGAKWHRGEVSATSSKGKAFTYSRVVSKQFKPRRSRGYVAYPAGRQLAPRFISLWVQTTKRLMHLAVEGKLK
jgi:hypothetical protein